MNKTLYIYAASANTWPVEQQSPELKPLVKQLWGKSYRRIDHFIQLAMVGARRCIDNSAVPIQPRCALVFASGQGNISQVLKVTEQIFKEQQPPMPFDFMHITNNMAPFYVAQALELSGRNLTVSHRAFAFETALDITDMHMQSPGDIKQTLIGAVDECALPLHHHRQRLNLPPNTPLAEGSHWILAGSDKSSAIARLEFCFFANSLEELLSRIAHHAETGSNPVARSTVLACGYGVDAVEHQNLLRRLNPDHTYDYRRDTAYHDTAAAYAIASFVASSAGSSSNPIVDRMEDNNGGRTLIHINKSPQQRYCALAVTALSSTL